MTRPATRFYLSGFDQRRTATTLDRRLRRAIDFINTHITDDLRLTTISFVAGLGPYHFSLLLSATMGVTPHRYLLELRIESQSNARSPAARTIHATAFDCGFKDTSAFARVFARETSLSPRRFRQAGMSPHSARSDLFSKNVRAYRRLRRSTRCLSEIRKTDGQGMT